MTVDRVLNVCEVLEDLPKFDGRIISVRGAFFGRDIRGPGFDVVNVDAVQIRPGCPPLTTGDYVWLNAIALDFPKGTDVEDEGQTQWTYDRDAYLRALEQAGAAQLRAMAELEEAPLAVMATIVGRLDVREWGLEVFTEGVVYPIPAGYGGGGVYPARLVLVSIDDIRVEEYSQSVLP
jgi:hypothetical protein